MKVGKLIRKFYAAIIDGNIDEQKRMWKKLLRKSLKGKKTHVINK
jgi:hypothetical protein